MIFERYETDFHIFWNHLLIFNQNKQEKSTDKNILIEE